MRHREAVTGWAALNWLGGTWFTGTTADGSSLPVPIVTHREVEAPPWVNVSQEHLRGGERIVVDGLPVTDAIRSVSFEARFAPIMWRAVAALDMACYSDLVTIAEMGSYAATIGPWTGIGLLRCNVPIFDRWGHHVGTPDLLDPVAGVIGEYDSALHLIGSQRTKDVRREGDFRALGLEYVTMLGSDSTDDYGSFLTRLHTAYGNARFAAEADRGWTIHPPHWWIDTTTVDARRNLPSHLQDRLLRYRRVA